MSDSNSARRAIAEIAFGGVDITKTIQPYLISLSYTDNEEDETDDLQIKIQDRDQLWLEDWLEESIGAAASGDLKIEALIVQKNWLGGGGDSVLPCGTFQLDDVSADGPPSTVTIKATSLPFSGAARQTKKNKAWEAYYLSGIANEIAGNAGMTCMFETASDPYYDRVEQFETSDIEFLSTLCHNAGVSLKVTNLIMVLFDQKAYEEKGSIKTIKKGDGSYVKYKLNTSSADTQYGSCKVSYTDPESGRLISATATAAGDDAKSSQCLSLTFKVASVAEAQTLAEKNLRLHNKFERQISFTLPGDTSLVAGVTVQVEGFGGWSGKYIVKQARHTLSRSGYTTQVTLRRILEGY